MFGGSRENSLYVHLAFVYLCVCLFLVCSRNRKPIPLVCIAGTLPAEPYPQPHPLVDVHVAIHGPPRDRRMDGTLRRLQWISLFA